MPVAIALWTVAGLLATAILAVALKGLRAASRVVYLACLPCCIVILAHAGLGRPAALTLALRDLAWEAIYAPIGQAVLMAADRLNHLLPDDPQVPEPRLRPARRVAAGGAFPMELSAQLNMRAHPALDRKGGAA
jgi:hypothetical protein